MIILEILSILLFIYFQFFLVFTFQYPHILLLILLFETLLLSILAKWMFKVSASIKKIFISLGIANINATGFYLICMFYLFGSGLRGFPFVQLYYLLPLLSNVLLFSIIFHGAIKYKNNKIISYKQAFITSLIGLVIRALLFTLFSVLGTIALYA